MRFLRVVLLLFFVFIAIRLEAQENKPDMLATWEYSYLEEWSVENDIVYGKVIWYYGQHFAIVREYNIKIGERIYYPICHYPTPIPMSISTGAEKVVSNNEHLVFPLERNMYSIPIRWDDDKVYTDYQEYKSYQSLYLLEKSNKAWHVSFGDSLYQPYHLTADSTELILYDYSMEVGDSYRHIDGHEDITVVEKDMVQLSGDGIPRRRLTLSNGMVLIEGLGCINSNGMLLDYLNPAAEYAGRFTYLATCDNFELKTIYDFTKDSNLIIVDTNTEGVKELSPIRTAVLQPMYDLQGRLLKRKPAHGVYIQNGRKIMR